MMKLLKQTMAVLVLALGLATFFMPATPALAGCNSPEKSLVSNGVVNENVCCPDGSEDSAESCLFAKYVNPVVVVLSALTGIAVVIGIVMGGIQYASSAGDPQKAAKGKSMITKSLVGLVSFMFLYSALQFFSPGGLAKEPVPTGSAADGTVAMRCSKEFFGLKPWFAYLPNGPNSNPTFRTGTCTIENFSLLGNSSDGKSSYIGYVALAIADNLVRIASMVAVAFVLVGGIQFVTSQGDPERAKKARQTILNALVGIIVALIAVALVSYVAGQLSS